MKRLIKYIKNIYNNNIVSIKEIYNKYITTIRVTIKKYLCRVFKINVSIIPLREEDVFKLEKQAGIHKFIYKAGETSLEEIAFNEGMKKFSYILRSEYVK